MFEPAWLRRVALFCGLILTSLASAGIYEDILNAAERNDTAEVIDFLRRGMDVNTSDASGNTLSMIAARNGNLELLEFLLRNRANILKRNKHGDSAIMLATFRGHLPVVQRLLQAGVEIGNPGWNPLHYAAFNGRTEILQLLVKSQAPLDAKAPNGQTALMLAASAGHLESVKTLIEADADMDLEDPEGRTAVMLAKKAGHVAVAEYLRAAGAVE